MKLTVETDITGGFAGKGIQTHFKSFMAADDDILSAFTKFGETNTVCDFVVDQTERYICHLYAKTFAKNICGTFFLTNLIIVGWVNCST